MRPYELYQIMSNANQQGIYRPYTINIADKEAEIVLDKESFSLFQNESEQLILLGKNAKNNKLIIYNAANKSYQELEKIPETYLKQQDKYNAEIENQFLEKFLCLKQDDTNVRRLFYLQLNKKPDIESALKKVAELSYQNIDEKNQPCELAYAMQLFTGNHKQSQDRFAFISAISKLHNSAALVSLLSAFCTLKKFGTELNYNKACTDFLNTYNVSLSVYDVKFADFIGSVILTECSDLFINHDVSHESKAKLYYLKACISYNRGNYLESHKDFENSYNNGYLKAGINLANGYRNGHHSAKNAADIDRAAAIYQAVIDKSSSSDIEVANTAMVELNEIFKRHNKGKLDISISKYISIFLSNNIDKLIEIVKSQELIIELHKGKETTLKVPDQLIASQLLHLILIADHEKYRQMIATLLGRKEYKKAHLAISTYILESENNNIIHPDLFNHLITVIAEVGNKTDDNTNTRNLALTTLSRVLSSLNSQIVTYQMGDLINVIQFLISIKQFSNEKIWANNLSMLRNNLLDNIHANITAKFKVMVMNEDYKGIEELTALYNTNQDANDVSLTNLLKSQPFYIAYKRSLQEEFKRIKNNTKELDERIKKMEKINPRSELQELYYHKYCIARKKNKIIGKDTKDNLDAILSLEQAGNVDAKLELVKQFRVNAHSTELMSTLNYGDLVKLLLSAVKPEYMGYYHKKVIKEIDLVVSSQKLHINADYMKIFKSMILADLANVNKIDTIEKNNYNENVFTSKEDLNNLVSFLHMASANSNGLLLQQNTMDQFIKIANELYAKLDTDDQYNELNKDTKRRLEILNKTAQDKSNKLYPSASEINSHVVTEMISQDPSTQLADKILLNSSYMDYHKSQTHGLHQQHISVSINPTAPLITSENAAIDSAAIFREFAQFKNVPSNPQDRKTFIEKLMHYSNPKLNLSEDARTLIDLYASKLVSWRYSNMSGKKIQTFRERILFFAAKREAKASKKIVIDVLNSIMKELIDKQQYSVVADIANALAKNNLLEAEEKVRQIKPDYNRAAVAVTLGKKC